MLALFSSFSNQPGYQVAFIGDSLTQMADWQTLLDRRDIFKYAVNGDITANMKKNVDVVINKKPNICFIMGGINDIGMKIPVDEVFANIRHMAVKMKSWGIVPVIQSTLFIQAEEAWYVNWNDQVLQLNKLLEDYCIKNEMEYLDLNKILSENKSLKSEYSLDGIHLNRYGYLIWSAEIKKILSKYDI